MKIDIKRQNCYTFVRQINIRLKNRLQFLSFILALVIFSVSLQAAPRFDLIHIQSGHKPAFHQGDQISFNAILEKENKEVQSNKVKIGSDCPTAALPVTTSIHKEHHDALWLYDCWLSGIEANLCFIIHSRHKQAIFPYHSHL